jgi:hypothetical protein
MIPELDRVLDAGYLDGLPERSTGDLRVMRLSCADLENGVSFVRRMAQGRVDLMIAEIARRETGSGGDAAGLVAQLPDLLIDSVRSSGSGRLTGDLEPPDEVVGPLTERLDEAAGSGSITGITELSDAELVAGVTALRDFEARLSRARHRLHSTVDSINDELARRYQAGESPTGG